MTKPRLDQDRPKVAIVAALEREVRPLVRRWRRSEKEHAGRRFRFFENGEAVLVCGGMGAEAARRAAEAVIVLYAPSVVYSVGYAGALDPRLKVGEVIEPQRIVNAGDGSSVTLSERHTLTIAAELRSAGQPHSTPPRDARGCSGQAWRAVPTCVLVSYALMAGPRQKAKLREAFGADAVDMEAAGVARAAEARGVGFGAMKVISDEFDFEFPALERFVSADGRFLATRFAGFVALRPWLWPRVIRLARDSRRATGALCDQLQKMSSNPMSASGEASEVVNRR